MDVNVLLLTTEFIVMILNAVALVFILFNSKRNGFIITFPLIGAYISGYAFFRNLILTFTILTCS